MFARMGILSKGKIAAVFFFLTFFDTFPQDSIKISTLAYRMPLKKHEANIEFHFRQKNFPLVRKIIGILEKEGVELFDYFSYRPSSTIHIILEEDWTRSNGSASLFPDNIVTIITFPALDGSFLSGKDDPIKNLVVHELAHIAHLDQAYGINRFLGRIFGSFGKLMPTVVPRWFSEGLATWAETHFTQGGRQRSPRVLWQVENSLLDANFCSNISCLDSPGSFPYGSNSYWMGADFLTWIEDKKEGSLACLVRENADNVAFFLGNAFVDCIGKNARQLFRQYRGERRAEIRYRQKTLKKNTFVKNSLAPLEIHRHGPMDLQKSAALLEGKFYYLWHRRRGGERIGIWDLEKGTEQLLEVPFYISSFLHPSGLFLPVSVENNHWARHHRKIVDLRDRKTLLEQNLKAEYAFAWEGEKWLYFSWQGERWVIGEYHSQEKGGQILYQLPPWVSIKRPRLFQKEGSFWLSFQVFDVNGKNPYQLWGWRVGDEKPQVLLKRSDAFTYWDQCNGVHVLKNSSKGIELVENNILQQVVSKKINVEWAEQISFMLWDADNTVVFLRDDPERAWHFAKGCSEIISELSREVNKKSVKMVSEIRQKKSIPRPFSDIKDYSVWQYMKPSWWLLGADYRNDQLYTTLETSLEDPKKFHQVALKGKIPLQGKKFDFVGSYARRFFDFREMYARIGYYYSQSESKWDKTSQGMTLSFYENFYLSKMTWTPILSLSTQRESERVHKATLAQKWVYRSPKIDAFLYESRADFHLSRSWGENSLAYTGWGSSLKIYMRPLSRLWMEWEVQYDKFLKKTFAGEIIYGGGNSGIHSFYGLNYQDAWGNEILTAGGRLDGELMRVYSSWGLIPFYIKEIRLLAGVEYIKADWHWLSQDKTYTREALNLNYWGLRMKLDLFYKNPGNWDFLQVNLYNPWGAKDTRFVSSLNLLF